MRHTAPGGLASTVGIKQGSRTLNQALLAHIAVPTEVARPVLVVPMSDGRTVTAIALYGSHEKGYALVDSEVRLLAQIASFAATAYIRCDLRSLEARLQVAAAS